MNNRAKIIDGLKKAMEFYRELGFEYLPAKIEQKRSPLTPDPCPLPLNKDIALQALRDEIGDCTRCKLSRKRTNLVFGEGPHDAGIMFIGEGPGRDEDIQARPFVGEAGKLLTNLIVKLGLTREEVYIANIVKCRPPNNREPDEEEIATCMPFVERQAEIIKPGVIVSLGRISAQSLLGTRISISKIRGRFFDYKGIPLMPTFHPAYLLRNPKDKWLTWDDMKKVLEKLKGN
ncbi:MAG: uracil-DNA glycosylase [Nitrospiraceae bacterium]|nr:MAG: uracil-DNA glycosylase [Nitrospiraceae bacterium]